MNFNCSSVAISKIGPLKPAANSILRIGIVGGGCNGFMYSFSWCEEKRVDDSLFLFGDVSIVIDKKSAKLLNGSTLDCGVGLADRGLFISNPNVAGSCGCGKSVQF